MRIAYIAPYHGPVLSHRRPVALNRSLANTTKLELIAGLLRRSGHEVEVLSQGEVDRSCCTYFQAATESLPSAPEVPVFYSSAFPMRRISGLWSSLGTLQLLHRRHRTRPYDAVIVWNVKEPQLVCGLHALRRLRLPTVLQYEDDMHVDMWGRTISRSAVYRRLAPIFFQEISGCAACSPHLLSQVPRAVPQLLLRGVVGSDLASLVASESVPRQNRVLFSGTHDPQKGIRQLIEAWSRVRAPGWELHITGDGPDTEALRVRSRGIASIHFHGLVSRRELIELMASARICANPHDLSVTPGNLFAFKIVEYLAAGAHVVTTPMGTLEPSLEAGVTYLPDNDPETIATTLRRLIQQGTWTRTASAAALAAYGPAAVAESLNALLSQAQELSYAR